MNDPFEPRDSGQLRVEVFKKASGVVVYHETPTKHGADKLEMELRGVIDRNLYDTRHARA